ncbi:unnamed protein product, partial [Prorocentrum cordatum]
AREIRAAGLAAAGAMQRVFFAVSACAAIASAARSFRAVAAGERASVSGTSGVAAGDADVELTLRAPEESTEQVLASLRELAERERAVRDAADAGIRDDKGALTEAAREAVRRVVQSSAAQAPCPRAPGPRCLAAASAARGMICRLPSLLASGRPPERAAPRAR